jgi:pyruvate/2-oxoglutarate dehydrogenase complex dihydrolipoamide acyltransferase (E2) component
MFRRNVKLSSKKVRLNGWRKSAISTWKLSKDCSIYCTQVVSAEPAKKYIEEYNRKNNTKLTLTHVAAKVSAKMIADHPQINRLMRGRNLYQREDVSLTILAANPLDPQNLSGIRLQNVDRMSYEDIANKTQHKNKLLKKGTGDDHSFMKKLMYLMPQRLVDVGLWALEKLLFGLNLNPSFIKFPKDPFGCLMISNIGYMNVQTAFSPLVPWTRVPLMLGFGKVYDKAVVINKEIKVQESIDLCWTVDHRLIDGLVGARMMATFEKYFTHPHLLE